MIIDFHTHVFPDALAPKAMASLSATSGLTPVTDGTVSVTRELLRRDGVDFAVLQHVATNPRQQHNVNEFAISLHGNGPFLCFGSVHPDAPDAADEAARLKAAGLPGVKLHPDYQGYDVDERRLWPLYDTLSQLGLVVCFHAGYDPLSPDHVHASPRMLAAVLKAFPRLRVVCAHFGGLKLWDEVEEELVGREVWLDTSFCAGRIPQKQAERIISRHGADHILLGSDCPWQAPAECIHQIESLDLRDSERERIFSGTARALLGM